MCKCMWLIKQLKLMIYQFALDSAKWPGSKELGNCFAEYKDEILCQLLGS